VKAKHVLYAISALSFVVVAAVLLLIYQFQTYVVPYLGEPPIREGPSLGQIAESLRAGLSPEEAKVRHGPPSSTGDVVDRAGEAVHAYIYYDARTPGSMLMLSFVRDSLVRWHLTTSFSHMQDNPRLSLTRSLGQVKDGMPPHEVERLLGRPADVTLYTFFPAREHQTHWTYYSAEDPDNRLWLAFENGKLTEKSVEPGGQLLGRLSPSSQAPVRRRLRPRPELPPQPPPRRRGRGGELASVARGCPNSDDRTWVADGAIAKRCVAR
jgi:hypothetical protein